MIRKNHLFPALHFVMLLTFLAATNECIAKTWTEHTAQADKVYLSAYNQSDYIIDGIAYDLIESSSTAIVIPFFSCNTITYWLSRGGIIADDYYFNHNGQSYSGVIEIPQTVEWNGRTYTVTGIDAHAFDNCYDVTDIVIPATVHFDYDFWFRKWPQDSSRTGYTGHISSSKYTTWYDSYEAQDLEWTYYSSSGVVGYHDAFPWLMKQPAGTVLYAGNRVERIINHSVKDPYRKTVTVSHVEVREGTTSIMESAAEELYAAKLTLPSTLKKIGSYAFRNSSLKEIYCHIYNPEGVADVTAFDRTSQNYADITLYVPRGTRDKYQIEPWKKFGYIIDALEVEPGTIPGDVDCNNIVNGSDVTSLYSFLLSDDSVAGNPDVDGNGKVNGSDVTTLYNILLK